MSYKLSHLKGNVAVECHNSEEWEVVKKIIGNPCNLLSFEQEKSVYKYQTHCITLSKSDGLSIGGHCYANWYVDNGYKIIQAKDFIRDNSEEEFKVGDWAYIIDKWDSRLTVGKVYQCNQINSSGSLYHFDNGSGKKDNRCWLKREHFRKAAPHEIPQTNPANPNPYNLKVGDKVFLDRYYSHKNDQANQDWTEEAEIPLNTELAISSLHKNDKEVGIEGYGYVHATAKFKPISMLNKSEYIEKIEDLVVGKWYGFDSGINYYEFCFAGSQGKKIKASVYYYSKKKAYATNHLINFGYFPIKEIPNPEEELKQYPATISESYKPLKKEDFYNCKIDVSESQELSEAVQKKLFELGFKWCSSGKNLEKCEYISIYADGELAYFISKMGFTDDYKKQIYPQDLGINTISGNIIVTSSYSEPKISDNQIVIPEIKKAIPNLNISIKPIEHIKLPDMSVKPKKVEKIKIEQFSLSI